MIVVDSDLSELNDLSDDSSFFFKLNELSSAGIYVTDKHGECLYTNKKWQQMAGLTFEEALGKGWEKALHPEDVEKCSEWYKTVDSHGKWNFKYRFYNNKTDETTPLLASAQPIYNPDHEIVGYFGMNVDLTHIPE